VCIKKNDLDEVSYVIFYEVQSPLAFIICPLDFLNNDFVEVDEAMFQGDERP
jgi:hypothetical protein